MSEKRFTRRGFLQTSSAAVATGALMPLTSWGLAQDPVVNAAAANNHAGYEKVGWKAWPFPMTQVRLKAGPLREMQERNRVYLFMLPNDRLLHSFRLTAGKSSTALPLGL